MWEKNRRLETYIYIGFPGGSESKDSACSAGDPDSVPGSGRSPGGGHGNHSSILAWRTPWTEEHGRLHIPWGCKELDMTEQLRLSLFFHKKM